MMISKRRVAAPLVPSVHTDRFSLPEPPISKISQSPYARDNDSFPSYPASLCNVPSACSAHNSAIANA